MGNLCRGGSGFCYQKLKGGEGFKGKDSLKVERFKKEGRDKDG
jgi:hypothetical protein